MAYTKSDEWLDKVSNKIEINFNFFENYIKRNIPQIEVIKSDSSFLIWLNMKKIFKNEDEIKKMFKAINVTYVLGSYFGMNENESFVRLNLGTSIENIQEVLKRMREYIQKNK